MSDAVLSEQMTYYRERAAEYDEWFYRQGRYDRGEPSNTQWFAEAAAVREALHGGPHVDTAVELACGTGIWTQELLPLADHITALDASDEMLALNRAKLGADHVAYRQVDLFAWAPEQTFGMVFAGFWLSHVPTDRLDAQLATMHGALEPGGRLFLVDSLRTQASTAADHVIPDDGTVLTRTLNDGRSFQIVKVFYDPEALETSLTAAGFDATVRTTGEFFWYADAVRR